MFLVWFWEKTVSCDGYGDGLRLILEMSLEMATISSKLYLILKRNLQRCKWGVLFLLVAPCVILQLYLWKQVCGGSTCVSLDVILSVWAAECESWSIRRYVGTQPYAACLNQIERVKNSLIRSRTRLPGSVSCYEAKEVSWTVSAFLFYLDYNHHFGG